MTAASSIEVDGSRFRLGTRPALDGIRGLGIILVVVFHSMTHLVDWYGPYGDSVLPGAFVSVDVFFALSGFLITSLLLEEREKYGTFSFRLFYIRRALRLLPALFIALGLFGVYMLFSSAVGISDFVRTTARLLTYTANFVIGKDMFLTEWFGQTWSLAIEEQFYIVWPIALSGLLLVTRSRPRQMLAILGAVTIAFAVWRVILLEMNNGLWSSVYYRTDARFDQPLVGALLAIAVHYGVIPDKPRPRLGVAALALWLSATMLTSPFEPSYYRLWAPIMLVGSCALMLGVMHAQGPAGWFLNLKPLRWFGRLSYAWYIIHVPVFAATLHALPGEGRNVLRVALANVVALGITVLVYGLAERPALRIKSRFTRSRQAAAAAGLEPTPGSVAVPRLAAPGGAELGILPMAEPESKP